MTISYFHVRQATSDFWSKAPSVDGVDKAVPANGDYQGLVKVDVDPADLPGTTQALTQAGMQAWSAGMLTSFVIAAPRIKIPNWDPPLVSGAVLMKTPPPDARGLAESVAALDGVYGVGVTTFSFQVLAIAWGHDWNSMFDVMDDVLEDAGGTVLDHRRMVFMDGNLDAAFVTEEIVPGG